MRFFDRNKKAKNKRKGITLIEVIVSMGILAIGSITAATLVISTIRSTVVSRDYLVSINLSREGIEAVRSMRDTNWMKFSYDTEGCWDVLDDEIGCPSTAFLQGTTKQTYRINMNRADAAAPFKWKLEKSSNADYVPSIDVNARKFFLVETDFSEENNELGNYRHLGVNEYSEGTSFYRAIIMEKEDTGSPEVNAIRVASVVQWIERGQIKETIAETIITNY